MNWRAWAAFVIVGVLWGSAWILISLRPAQEFAVGALRFAIAAAVLALIAFAPLFRRPRTQPFPISPSLVLGATMVGVPYALAVWAKDAVSPGMFPVLYSAMPLAALFFTRKVSVAQFPAAAIGMGGIALVVAQGISYSSGQWVGLLLLAAAVLLGAFSLNYAKPHIHTGSFLLSSAIQCAVASALLVGISAVKGQLRSSWRGQSLAAVAVLAVAEGVIALPLLYWLLARIEPWQAAALQWLATLCAVSEAVWFLRAKPTLQMVAGAVLAVGALIWLLREADRSEGESDVVTLQITSVLQNPRDASESK